MARRFQTAAVSDVSGISWTSNGSHTVACWMYVTNAGGGADGVYGDISTNGSQNSDSIWLGVDGSTNWTFQENGGTYNFTQAASTNTWTHLCLTYDGTNCRAYVNGSLVNTGAFTVGSRAVFQYFDTGFGSDVHTQDCVVFNRALSQVEIAGLMRLSEPPMDSLFLWWAELTGAPGLDYSGKRNNWTSDGSTAGTTFPATTFMAPGPRRIWQPPSSGTSITAAGTTQTTGSASITSAAGIVGAGTTQVTGAAAMTSAAGLVASGLVQVTGAAALAIAATGTTQTTGSASLTATASLAATGTTQTTGAAALGATFPIAASGTTQTTGAATFAGTMTAAGTTQTTGASALTAFAGLVATGTTQVTGAASLTSAAGLTAVGTTQTTGTAAVTSASALSASGLTQTTGAATLAATFSTTAAGLTQTTGVATVSTNAGVPITATGLTRTMGGVPELNVQWQWIQTEESLVRMPWADWANPRRRT